MQTFQVEPTVVRAYAGVLSLQSGHAANAADYVGKHATIDESAISDLSVITTAQAHHPAVLAIVKDAINRSVTFFTDASTAMGETADFYESTDAEAAATLDATYTGAEDYDVVYESRPDMSHAPQETTDPSAVLTEPTYDEGKFDPNPFGVLSDWNNIFSPAVWVNTFVKDLLGYDILEQAQNTFAGDWTAFAKAGAAFHTLARCYQELAVNTGEFAQLPKYWQGEALDLTVTFFAGATYTLYNEEYIPRDLACNPNGGEHIYSTPVFSGYYGLFTVLGDEYYKLAQGMSELANAVSGAIGTLFDMCFWAGVAAGVAAGTSELVLPAVVSGLLGAGALANAMQKATEITGMLESATFAVNAFTGLDAQGTTMPVVDAIEQLALPSPSWAWTE
jgi:hypothetical protein